MNGPALQTVAEFCYTSLEQNRVVLSYNKYLANQFVALAKSNGTYSFCWKSPLKAKPVCFHGRKVVLCWGDILEVIFYMILEGSYLRDKLLFELYPCFYDNFLARNGLLS